MTSNGCKIHFLPYIFSTIPFADLFDGGPLFKILGFLKIIRLQRISEVIMNLNRTQETKAGYKVVYLIFLMFMYIHIFGCIWKQLVTVEEEWVPNKEFIFFGTPQIYEYYYSPWNL